MTLPTREPLSGRLITLVAVAIGIIVANLYYLQPLLHQISRDFHVGTARASLLMTLIQVGYALGLAFVANAVIGLFGLFGVAGVLAANAAGRQADRQRAHVSTIVAALLLLLSSSSRSVA